MQKKVSFMMNAAVTYYGNSTWILHLYSQKLWGKKGYTITRPYNGSPEQEKDILYSEFSRGLWSGLILAIFYKFLKLSLIPKLQKGEGNAYAYIKAMILIWVSLVCDLMSVLSKIIRLYVFEQRLLIVCYHIWLQLPFSVLRNDEKLV